MMCFYISLAQELRTAELPLQNRTNGPSSPASCLRQWLRASEESTKVLARTQNLTKEGNCFLNLSVAQLILQSMSITCPCNCYPSKWNCAW